MNRLKFLMVALIVSFLTPSLAEARYPWACEGAVTLYLQAGYSCKYRSFPGSTTVPGRWECSGHGTEWELYEIQGKCESVSVVRINPV